MTSISADKIYRILSSATRADFLWAVLSVIGTLGLGYFTERSNTWQFFGWAGLLCGVYFIIVRQSLTASRLAFYLVLAVLLRMLLLPSFPLLSDDIYRFIWDGHLLREGISPFEHLPEYYAQNGFAVPGLSRELYSSLNSPHYYTVYPPTAQFTFWCAVLLFPQSWLGAATVMRFFLLLFEIGSIFFLVRLLQHFRIPVQNALLYALNPLIIIEITGNLHFEGGMIFFLLAAIYFLVKKHRLFASAGLFALSVASKLLPLLFLPFLIKRLGLKKAFVYFSVIGILLLLLFLPLVGSFFLTHFGESLDLYFRKFEFNASIYYLWRYIGYEMYGYNIIQSAGPKLAALTFFGIMTAAFTEHNPTWRKLPLRMLFAVCLYLLLTTTVHPWYTALPVVLCVFTPYRFPILWSALIWMTYADYGGEVYEEKLILVTVEYLCVTAFALYEIFFRKASDKGK